MRVPWTRHSRMHWTNASTRTDMKKLLPLILLVLLLISCASTERESSLSSSTVEVESIEHVDYTSSLKLDMTSPTKKTPVTVKLFVDGDTTHFNVPQSVSSDGVLKARYLAVNTPESTGKIEPWGKKASEFTRERLETAVSIIVESDDGVWNLDSTGGRYLVWVWYQREEGEDYRCLNLELLEEGLAIASASGSNRYGTYCLEAIAQAKREKKCVWSGENDPGFYYGDSIPLTLKELRAHVSDYDGLKVSFEGVVTRNSDNSVYIEDRDEETGMQYGISVYYGYSLSGGGLRILKPGNRVKIVGTVQYYEGDGTYQVSGIKYREMKKDDPDNIQLISSDNVIEYDSVDLYYLLSGSVTFALSDEDVTMAASSALEATTVTVGSLYVEDGWVNTNESSSYYGALTLSVSDGQEEINIRTIPLRDSEGAYLKAESFIGKTIEVRGIVENYQGVPEIYVFSVDDILIED